MYNAFWRIILAIKYWRVLLPSSAAAGTPARDQTLGFKITMALFFLVPFSIGLGFGYLSWTHGNRLAEQNAVDRNGVAVTAIIEASQIEEIRHQSTAIDGERSTPEPSYFCNLQVSYLAPGLDDVRRKAFRLEDASICERYPVGESIQGKLLPDKPDVMVLDEARLDVFWYRISGVGFMLFAGLPLFLLIRGLVRWTRRAPA